MYLPCTRSNNFYVEYSTGYGIEKGEVVMQRSNHGEGLTRFPRRTAYHSNTNAA